MKKILLLLITAINIAFAYQIEDIQNDEVYKSLKLNYEKQRYIAVMIDNQPKPTKIQSEIVDYAIGLLGIKYQFGGETINGMDCSSFVQKVFAMAGIYLPRTARYQAKYGIFVDKEDLKPGDLLFFQTYAKFPSHVGIYIGEGKMIHASSKGKKILISDINKPYYVKHFIFAKRLFLYDPKMALNNKQKVKNGKN